MKKVYNREFMRKRWPMPPRFVCSSRIKQLLGIVSPSLYLMAWRDEEKARLLGEYTIKSHKYLCWKRILGRDGWKDLYRHVREERKAGADHGTTET